VGLPGLILRTGHVDCAPEAPAARSALAPGRRLVEQVRQLTEPAQIHWCDGSDAEYVRLRDELAARGELKALNQTTFPGCYLYRSDPNDVARVEHVTYVCTATEEQAGPNNNWMPPAEAKSRMQELFRGCMRGRTLYVVPYCMGPIDSPFARCGVEITDSAYVVLNMALMTRMGRPALERIASEEVFVRGPALDRGSESCAPLHHALSRRALDPELRLRVRWQRAAGQEVSCTAHRELASTR